MCATGVQDTPSGVSEDDLKQAVLKVFRQNANMNHQEILQAYAYELSLVNQKIVEIKPCKIK